MSSRERLPELIALLADLATLVAAITAIWGIVAWWHQLRRTTEYRLAMRVYRVVLRLRNRIFATRSGMNHMLWLTKEEAANEERSLQREHDKYLEWFREVVKAALVLRDLRPEVEMHWGRAGTQHIDDMDEMARRLRGGYRAYFEHSFKALKGARGMAEAAEADRKIAFEPPPDEPDPFGDEIAERVEKAARFLRPKCGL